MKIDTSKLHDHVRDELGHAELVFCGRATTGLYLWLRGHGIRDRTIALPVNVCYSIVHAITLSENRPLFLDVDPRDGNLRLAHVEAREATDLAALMVPHMFGNPCAEIDAIGAWCRERGVQLMEDCALALGCRVGERPAGSFGDAAIFSFGPGKTLDAGGGGLLACREAGTGLRRLADELPSGSANLERKTKLYATLYRELYHSDFYDELAPAFGRLHSAFADIYLFRSTATVESRIVERFERFDAIRRAHLAATAYYDARLPFGDRLMRYEFAAGAVPWRYNLRIADVATRDRVVAALLDAGLPVSRWYPPVHGLFGVDGDFPGATAFASEIVNVPVAGGDEVARRVVTAVEGALRG